MKNATSTNQHQLITFQCDEQGTCAILKCPSVTMTILRTEDRSKAHVNFMRKNGVVGAALQPVTDDQFTSSDFWLNWMISQ